MNAENLNSAITIDYSERARSIIDVRSVITAFFISAFYHVAILIISPDRANIQTPLLEFWLFVLSDVVIWTLGLIPFLAVWYGKLSWYDPFFLLWAITFGTYSTAFLAVSVDPFSTASWMSFGASNGFDAQKGNFYLCLFQAEIIIFLYMFILLLTNQRVIKYSSGKASQKESWAALITGTLFGALGIYGFFRFWGERSFLTAVLSANGTFIPEIGTARFMLFQGIAGIAISLGLVGFLSRTRQGRKKKRVNINWFVLIVILGTLIPHLVTGSRLNILIALVTPFVVLRFFNFSIEKRILGITLIALILFWFTVTIFRGNTYTSWVSSSSTKFSFSDAVEDYSQRLSSTSVQLLYADRVGNVAYIVNNLNENNQFLYGQSLIAGLGNYAADFLMRLEGKRLMEKPFLWANQYITQWRFGNPNLIGWPVPPSVEGEFYMQGGFISLITLSYLLGRLFFWSRQMIASTSSLIIKWFVIECLINIAFYFAMGEVSSVYTYIIFLAIVAGVYELIRSVVGSNRFMSEYSWSAGLNTKY